MRTASMPDLSWNMVVSRLLVYHNMLRCGPLLRRAFVLDFLETHFWASHSLWWLPELGSVGEHASSDFSYKPRRLHEP